MRIETGIPFDDYSGIKAWNASLLKAVNTKPLDQVWAEYVDPNRERMVPTPAMLLGTLTHECLYEPDRFRSYFALQGDKRTKAYKEALAKAEADGLRVVDSALHEQAIAMAAAVRDHASIGHLFEEDCEAALNELTITWQSDDQPCKARLDCIRLTSEGIWIGDLKTTQSAAPEAFGKSAHDYGYLLQGAFYADGVMAVRSQLAEHLGMTAREAESVPVIFEFIAVEKASPHRVARYRLTADQYQLGKRLYERAMAIAAKAKSMDYWPGYSTAAQPLTLPPWAERQIETLLEEG